MGELNDKMTALANNVRDISKQEGMMSINDMTSALENSKYLLDYEKIINRDNTLLSYSSDVEKVIPYMFSQMKVQDVSLPNITITGQGLFYSCLNLTTVNIPSVTHIGSNTFEECNNLVNLNLGDTNKNTYLFEYAFKGCSSITQLNFGKTTGNFTGIFQNCSSLATLTFKSLQGTFSISTLENCDSLETLVIYEPTQEQINWINNGSPTNSNPLVRIEADTLEFCALSWGNGKIYVPDILVNAYKNATNWSNYANYIYPSSEYISVG